MLNDCVSAEDTTEELCQCMLDATVSEFSYEEYQSLQTLQEGDISEELQQRSINLMMAMMECAL